MGVVNRKGGHVKLKLQPSKQPLIIIGVDQVQWEGAESVLYGIVCSTSRHQIAIVKGLRSALYNLSR